MLSMVRSRRLYLHLHGGMGKECTRYHSRLAELIPAKKGAYYSIGCGRGGAGGAEAPLNENKIGLFEQLHPDFSEHL